MLRVPTAVRLLQVPLKSQVALRAPVSTRPARTPTSAGEQAIGLTTMVVSFLVPAGWVLSNLENYKKSSAE